MHDYDETEESAFIQYLDFNNQCGWALSQLNPYGGFDYFEDTYMVTHDFIISNNNNSYFGYKLIIDRDFLFLPKKIVINKEKK